MVKQIEKVGESHLILKDGSLVKDFARLGRDQRKMVIVDCNRPENKSFLMNYIDISVWTGSKSDKALYKLTQILDGRNSKI